MPELNHISANLQDIRNAVKKRAVASGRIADDITLIAVSKTFPVESVIASYLAGQLDFGENKAQEMCSKYETLSKSSDYQRIKWHLVGHLQTNKVKSVVPFVSLIHSLSSFHLVEKIQNEAAKIGRTINCLVQVNTSGEEQKSGIAAGEVIRLVSEASQMKNIRIRGLMTIAKFIDDYHDEKQRAIVRGNFRELKKLFDELAADAIPGVEMKYLSMGMTSDYDIALEEGSNMLRIGTAIFGKRNISGNN